MNDLIISEMKTRLDRLEARNRLLTLAVLVLLCACGLIAVMSAANPWDVQGVVRAKSFVVVDDIGNNRAELGIATNGTCGLFVRDNREDTRMEIVTEFDGTPVMMAYDSFGAPRVMLSTAYDGTPRFSLYNSAGKRLFTAP
jgi:hypothetical protein